ncbi:arginyl-tRNA synthetase [Grosmannia clavigera kw1407]|uniref:Arginyl-tRNA synthetase n=1 Tax=Grosmannia clavigera (strain kw1407 / UAMH 11150) TaxID=655863 RepID=F0X879_GROCL|nr:arginyl-tRNA synthetase [Grosmannia clavigera kw1407]EFX05280.1 arginyl-tRNA synthetase [Grosmannia clavigera kw1407]
MATVAGLEALLVNLGLEMPVPRFPAADVLAKPIDVFRGYLATLLGSILTLDASAIYAAIASTSDISLGDLDVIIPRLRLSIEDVQREFNLHRPVSPLFQRIFVEGVHIRCFFSLRTLPGFLLPYIRNRGALYGQETQLGLRDVTAPEKGYNKVVVEFSSPNVPSEFSDMYLRSTILGSFISNLYESMGCEVVRLNYLGDWGKQIGLLAVGWQRYGKEDALAEDPVGHLLDIKAHIEEDFRPEIKAIKDAKEANQDAQALEGQGIFEERDAYFKKMEDGDADAVAL